MFVFEGAIPKDFVQPIQHFLWSLPVQSVFGSSTEPPGDARNDLAGPQCCTTGHHNSHAALQLKQALQKAQHVDGTSYWKSQLLNTAGALVQYGGVLSAVASSMSPRGPGCCDSNCRERTLNLITSLPYAWIGIHGMRKRKTPQGRAWGVSMLGVAGGSLVFHSSRGRWRCLGRKFDYWMIAASSAMLTRALYPNQPGIVTAASLLVTPFRPFMVSTLHTMAMELAFLRRAADDLSLRGAQRFHSAAALAGMALFFLEDAQPHIPMVHCSWHMCSAGATNAIHALLEDAEQRQGAAPDRARGGGLLLPAHQGCAERGGAAAAAVARDLVVAPLQLTAV